jgi:hypothetical protein
MHIDEQTKIQQENAEKLAEWDALHQAEAERQRLQSACEELARERESRLRTWMEAGGSPEDFDKAWPSMQQALIMERHKARQDRAEDVWS